MSSPTPYAAAPNTVHIGHPMLRLCSLFMCKCSQAFSGTSQPTPPIVSLYLLCGLLISLCMHNAATHRTLSGPWHLCEGWFSVSHVCTPWHASVGAINCILCWPSHVTGTVQTWPRSCLPHMQTGILACLVAQTWFSKSMHSCV